MAKFITVLCAVIATASAGPGLVAPLGGVPLAYTSGLSYSSPLSYSASLAYTSPVAYGLASGGSSRIDIQNNYNVAPQFAVPSFAARIAAPYAAAPVPLSAPFIPAPLNYNFAQLAAPQVAQVAPAAPVAFGSPLAPAPVAVGQPLAKIATPSVPVPLAAPQFIPAPLRYSAPLLSNYNAAATAFYGSPLPYAFPGQFNALQYAAPLAAAPGLPIAGQFAAPPSVQLADPSVAATTRMTAVPSENPEADSEEVPAKLVSESPASNDEEQKFATPAPVDGPQTARDASQSPVAPVTRNNNNN